jgi:hypothetical protein
MYDIRYSHKPWSSANSVAEALKQVRAEFGIAKLPRTKREDGIYCYRSIEAKNDDDDDYDRSNPDAVICPAGS